MRLGSLYLTLNCVVLFFGNTDAQGWPWLLRTSTQVPCLFSYLLLGTLWVFHAAEVLPALLEGWGEDTRMTWRRWHLRLLCSHVKNKSSEKLLHLLRYLLSPGVTRTASPGDYCLKLAGKSSAFSQMERTRRSGDRLRHPPTVLWLSLLWVKVPEGILEERVLASPLPPVIMFW